jgi:hypothetical protein
MAEGRQETREEEVARVRSYLVSQAAKRTPEQLVEALREAQRQFLLAVGAVPDGAFLLPPRAGEWSAADVVGHVREMAEREAGAICGVLAGAKPPSAMTDRIAPAPVGSTRADLLGAIEDARQRLIAAVLQADPAAHLDITWAHSEFGALNWREWLLFARVHTLDHARQLQAIATALTTDQG